MCGEICVKFPPAIFPGNCRTKISKKFAKILPHFRLPLNISCQNFHPNFALGNYSHNTSEGVLKRYLDIGDRPKKVQSNPPNGPIEPLTRFYRNPFWPPTRLYRTPVKGFSEPQTGFYRTFRVEPPPFQAALLKLSLQNS